MALTRRHIEQSERETAHSTIMSWCGVLALVRKVITPARGKLKSSAGMTLGEMLAAIVIVGLMSAGLATAVTLGVQQYGNSIRTSESQQLFTTLQNVIDNELRYTDKIFTSEGQAEEQGIDRNKVVAGQKYTVAMFHSDVFGDKSTQGHTVKIVSVNDAGEVIDGPGQVAFENVGGTVYTLLGKKNYNMSLVAHVSNLTFKNGYFTYTLEICRSDNDETLISQTINVRAMNMALTSTSTQVS